MENRTPLKEKRNDDLIVVWFIISFLIGIVAIFNYGRADKSLAIILGTQFCFLLYRVLTYFFNSLLLIFFRGEKYKINRLKGRITPIYRIYETYEKPTVGKWSVYYTKLDLKWSIPFSVLFEEQEYLFDGSYRFDKIPESLEEAWERRETEENEKVALKTAEKDKKQQKLDKLNKVFNENYK